MKVYFENCKQIAEKIKYIYTSLRHFGLMNVGSRMHIFRVISSWKVKNVLALLSRTQCNGGETVKNQVFGPFELKSHSMIFHHVILSLIINLIFCQRSRWANVSYPSTQNTRLDKNDFLWKTLYLPFINWNTIKRKGCVYVITLHSSLKTVSF